MVIRLAEDDDDSALPTRTLPDLKAVFKQELKKKHRARVSADKPLAGKPETELEGEPSPVPGALETPQREPASGPSAPPEVVFRSRAAGGARVTREQFEAELGRGRGGPPKAKKRITEAEMPHGGGLVQKREAEAKAREEEEILRGGFYRTEIQESLDKELRDRHLAEDPMKDFLRPDPAAAAASAAAAAAEPRFEAPPNRFGIRAGRRWDGRIRGTGFEEKYLEALSLTEQQHQR